MNVLMVNTACQEGGAALALEALRKSLVLLGHAVEVGVGLKPASSDPTVNLFPQQRGLVETVLCKLAYELGLGDIGLLGTRRALKTSWFEKADVINFHNLHGGFFNFLALPAMLRKKPGILTLHDMWSFTGHCIYSFDCDRWLKGCGRCPSLQDYPSVKRDATALSFLMKRWAFVRRRLHVVAISRWMESQARRSLLAMQPIHYIPNGVDLSVYQPRGVAESRALLGLPEDRPIVLYVAHHVSDPRKGFDLLIRALHLLSDRHRHDLTLLLLGNARQSELEKLPVNVRNLGYVSDVGTKRAAFDAADVLAFPTRSDNLPVVLQESLACGTPMVSFNVGGVPDLVKNGETGLLAPAGDYEAFANNLTTLLDSLELRQAMSRRCRALAEQEFGLDLQGRRYSQLFELAANDARQSFVAT